MEELQAKVAALLEMMAGGKGSGGGVAGAAKEAATGLKEFGISLDDIRRAGAAANLSQSEVDAAILRMGGTILGSHQGQVQEVAAGEFAADLQARTAAAFGVDVFLGDRDALIHGWIGVEHDQCGHQLGD